MGLNRLYQYHINVYLNIYKNTGIPGPILPPHQPFTRVEPISPCVKKTTRWHIVFKTKAF